MLISTNRDWTPEARQTIDRRLAEAGADRADRDDRDADDGAAGGSSRAVARMVELRAVQPAFPLYGTLDLEGGQPYSHAMLQNHGVLVRPELLTALGVKVGDQIVIGQATFTIRGVITNEPGRRVGDFSLGPRVLIDFDDLPATGLLSFGSRARHVLLVRVPESRIEPLVTALADRLQGRVRQRALVPRRPTMRSAATSIARRTT